jgi:hypothetical protein
MRTSGGRGAEGRIMAFPILALIVAASMSSGGLNVSLISLESVVRQTITSVVDFVIGLF